MVELSYYEMRNIREKPPTADNVQIMNQEGV